MRGRRELKSMWRDPRMKELIDSLWREYYGLYAEKYKSTTELDELGEPIDQWLRNKLSRDINFAQALGQDHLLEGNRSTTIGQGAVTKSFMEIVLGAYNIIPEDQNAEEWISTDLLLTLGNGPDEDNRSNVFEIYKNGFFKFLNAIKIGAWDAGVEGAIPENGTLQWTPENGLEEWDTDHWNPVGFKFPDTVSEATGNIVAGGKHTHKLEINGKPINQAIPEIVKTINGNNHESFLIENTTNVSETVFSSWTVIPYKEQTGEFKAVVMVRNKITNTIITLMSLLSFDYSDAVAAISQSDLITDPGITLTIGVNGSNILYATITGMPEVNKRIHLCFERCVLSERESILQAEATMELNIEANLTADGKLEADAAMQLNTDAESEGDGLLEVSVELSLEGEGEIIADGTMESSGILKFDGSAKFKVDPAIVGRYDSLRNAKTVRVSGNYAYVADGGWGTKIFDVTDTTNPIWKYTISEGSYDLFTRGNRLYIIGGNLAIYNITNPLSPTLVGSCVLPTYSGPDVWVDGNYAYCACGSYGLQIVDISTESAPVIVGSYKGGVSGLNCNSVCVVGDVAYVGENGFRTVNVSDRAHPSLISVFDVGNDYLGIKVVGNYAFVAKYSNTQAARVINISNPASLSLASSITLGSPGYDVSVYGNYAFYAVYWTGMHIVNISNPADILDISVPYLGQYVTSIYYDSTKDRVFLVCNPTMYIINPNL